MKKTSLTCQHDIKHQITTSHGLFCLECGRLHQKAANAKKLAHSPSPLATKQVISGHKEGMIAVETNKTPVKISRTIKIGVADITPRKRAKL